MLLGSRVIEAIREAALAAARLTRGPHWSFGFRRIPRTHNRDRAILELRYLYSHLRVELLGAAGEAHQLVLLDCKYRSCFRAQSMHF